MHYKDDLNIIEKCTSSIQNWFIVNDLLLNPTKSEVIAIGTATQRCITISTGTVAVGGAPLSFADNIRSLSVQIDSDLSFDAHVNAVCRSCNHHIWALRQIRNNLSPDTAKTVACAIVSSRLDYCNSLLHNISKKNIQKLQRIQNNLTRVELKAPRLTSPKPMLASLHWLPVVYRIQYKLAIITFKALTTGNQLISRTCFHCTGYLSSTGYSISWLSLLSKLWLQSNQLISRTCSNVWPSDSSVHQPPILSSFHRFTQTWLHMLSVMLHLPSGRTYLTMLEKQHK